MLNDTETKIVITMNHVDHSTALYKALVQFQMSAGMGGDCELMIKSNDEILSCGFVGHDVCIKFIRHNLA